MKMFFLNTTLQSASSEDSAENHADREQSPETEGNGIAAAAPPGTNTDLRFSDMLQ